MFPSRWCVVLVWDENISALSPATSRPWSMMLPSPFVMLEYRGSTFEWYRPVWSCLYRDRAVPTLSQPSFCPLFVRGRGLRVRGNDFVQRISRGCVGCRFWQKLVEKRKCVVRRKTKAGLSKFLSARATYKSKWPACAQSHFTYYCVEIVSIYCFCSRLPTYMGQQNWQN